MRVSSKPDAAKLTRKRDKMVEKQLIARGMRDEAVLAAVRKVPREAFVDPALVEYAYEDTPLPIEEAQTISQPYIVALMAEMLELTPSDRVLEVGTGSGYAAAVLGELAGAVYTIERHASLAAGAAARLSELGYDHVQVRHGDGSEGWPEAAPFDAIVVAAGGPNVPEPLRRQLSIGGRLVMPIGRVPRSQKLIRIRRTGEDSYTTENMGDVRFVPLVGRAGWAEDDSRQMSAPTSIVDRIGAAAEPFGAIEQVALDRLLDRIGEAQLVLLGEASHGTEEFYTMRAQITQALIERKGFRTVAVEADWPDAARIDRYVRDTPVAAPDSAKPFSRFPTWMWANTAVLRFLNWLRGYNQSAETANSKPVGFYGLDLYSLHASIDAVLHYLEDVDSDAAAVARVRYGCLTPWEQSPAAYGAAAVAGRYESCEADVVAMLNDLLAQRMNYTRFDGQRFLDALQNARLVADAERYYRAMYYGSTASWNLRDQHMFDTLQFVLNFRGPQEKAVIWAHNSHIGDARATEMGQARDQINIGQLARERYGEEAYLIGFGTDHGTVAAAQEWGGKMAVMPVTPAHRRSYERLCHASGEDRFLLPLRHGEADLRRALALERLERAIGVIYRPERELESHYFYASLPDQFDEYVWLDETQAVTPLSTASAEGMPDTYPFGV